MKRPIKHTVKSRSPTPVSLDALTMGSQAIAFQSPQNSLCEHGGAVDKVGAMLDGNGNMAAQETGGRSESFSSTAKETAKPLSPIPPLDPSSDHSSIQMVTVPPNPDGLPPSHMPVLGDLRGVHRKEGPKVGESSHTGGIHSKTGPILGHKGSDIVVTSLNVPYSPDVPEPSSTEEVSYGSPFITGNERIDRRTAFTQFCRLGEGRTYMKVAEIMGSALEVIKEWAKEDNWENAYRERVTADIVQVAKEENIHDYLDAKKAMISLIKGKVMEAQAGKDVFRNTKELIDTMVKLEELTGAGSVGNVRPGQIFIIIDKEEWEAREKMNESARIEEAKA